MIKRETAMKRYILDQVYFLQSGVLCQCQMLILNINQLEVIL